MKTVLITGASGGLGIEIVKQYMDNKHNIIMLYNNNRENIDKLSTELDKKNISYMTIKCDLKKEDEIDNMLNIIYKKYNNIDILINNAALEINCELKDKTKEQFLDVLSVNLLAPFLLSKKIGLKMKENKYGKIINISSDNAIDKYDPLTLEYDASKAALISLTNNFAKELAPYVYVNAIAPGWILTPEIKKMNDDLDGLIEDIIEPSIITKIIYELTADNNKITNEIIRIEGGKK